MARSRKVIITCAVTSAIHTPTMSPYLPVTPDEIADAAIGAAEAGATIVHLHARDPRTGRPDQTSEALARFLPRIKQPSSVVINLTSGGSPTMSVDERVRPAAQFKPEVASLNMGSLGEISWGHLGPSWRPRMLVGCRRMLPSARRGPCASQ
jgi:3,5-dioxohexanoate:acetyl-CoA acetone transferase